MRLPGRLAGFLALLVSVVGSSDASTSISAPPGPSLGTTTSITINGAALGPSFQGIGAVSGGGGNSRLLADYPKAQRTAILDYLFKPGYGASLQILKLEIGGDANSTDGSEPSVEHRADVVDCAADYEFWLAKQARVIDPALKLYGLQWSAPSWVSGGAQTLWTAADIRYVITWLNCARSYGLTISYIGGWNEHGDGSGIGGPAWYEDLRAALDKHGYHRVEIVAADSIGNRTGTDVADDLAADPQFDSVVNVLGYHNSCQYPTTGIKCVVPAAASSLGRPIWESEIGRMDANSGAAAMVRSINRAFIDARVTSLIEWPLVDSMPPFLPMENRGLVWADQPWSGHYHVNLMTWAIAQTTQFVQPGWRYLDGASGQLGGPDTGTYVAYEAPNRTAWSMVLQTSMAATRERVTVHVDGRLDRSVVHVWSTNLRRSAPKDWFVQDTDVRPRHGTFGYTLRPGYVYTFTTTTGQHHGGVYGGRRGQPTDPRSRPMPLNYTARPDAAGEPAELAAQNGAFQYAPGDAVIKQLAIQPPVYWQIPDSLAFPYAVVGGADWANYRVATQLRFTAPGQSVGVLCRYRRPRLAERVTHFYGYQLSVSSDGSWQLVQDLNQASPATLAAGTVAPLGVGTWHAIALAASGPVLTASIDDHDVASVAGVGPGSAGSPGAGRGLAGISTGGWYQVDFRDLTVRSIPIGAYRPHRG